MEIVPARVSEVIEQCQESLVENFEDGWISINEAESLIGYPAQRFGALINTNQLHGKILNSGKKYVRRCDVEAIPGLREKYGVRWLEFAPWRGQVNNEVPRKRETSRASGDEMSTEAARISQRLIDRARELHEKGSFQASNELIWAVFDEFEILN
jgi:hypothetical protein